MSAIIGPPRSVPLAVDGCCRNIASLIAPVVSVRPDCDSTFYSVMMWSAHSISETNIVGLPDLAP